MSELVDFSAKKCVFLELFIQEWGKGITHFA